MNAVRAPRLDPSEEQPMSPIEQTTSADPLVALCSDVHHLQSDITEIKGDVRIASQRMDSLRIELSTKIDNTDKKIDSFRSDLTARIDGGTVRTDLARSELTGKIDEVNKTLTGKIDGSNKDLTSKIDGSNKDLTSKIDEVNKTLTGKIDGKIDSVRGELTEIRKSISAAKIWALVLYGALIAAVFTLLARAFKWL